MKVKDLIELLLKCNQEADVIAYDADTEDYEDVTGIDYSETVVEIQTDDNS